MSPLDPQTGAELEAEQALVREYLGPHPAAFVEVGAHHPRWGSQTYHLAQRGWIGILVEPQEAFYRMLNEARPEAHVVRAACTSPERVGTVTLHIPPELGFATLEPSKEDFYLNYARQEDVCARTLDEIIEEWRKTTGSRVPIRFLAIDVEGHEPEVLRGVDLARHKPDLVLVEDKLQDLSRHRLLRRAGYRLVRRTTLNNWYIPHEAKPPARFIAERLSLFRKVFLGLPFRRLRRWRHSG
jgi:FkbM family methyltransferase